MTILYSHQDRLDDMTGGSLLRALAHLIASGARTAFTRFHQAIVTAKIRRLERERIFHDVSGDGWSPDAPESYAPDTDARKFPRQPLILGDKWDF